MQFKPEAMQQRSVFDQISLSVIPFLQAQKGVCDIDLVEKAPATEGKDDLLRDYYIVR